ncbi:MAG: c-type cytochrome, partial [Verrucomicrobiota bacterium]
LLPHLSFPATGLNFTPEECRTWILRRAANAAFRLGGDSQATALARLAGRADAPEAVRMEALEALGQWAGASRRDRIVGLIRPLAPRDPLPAAAALAAAWESLAAAAQPAPVLAAALQAAARLPLPDLPGRLEPFAQHPDPIVRETVARLRPAPPANLLARLDSSDVPEQQAALARLAGLGPNAPAPALRTLATRLDQLLAGQLPAALHLDVLEAAAALPDPAVADRLRRWTNALPAGDTVAPFRPVLAGGNAAEGRRLFAARADWGCQRCHQLGGEGGNVGPDLTGLGRAKGREYALTSILHPNQQIAPSFETVVLTLRDGTFRSGVLRQESSDTLVLDSPEDGRLTLRKAEVRARERGLSSMPEGLADLMTRRELRDVLEALSQ